MKHCAESTETYTNRRILHALLTQQLSPVATGPIRCIRAGFAWLCVSLQQWVPEPGAPLDPLQEARLDEPGFGRGCTAE